MSKKWAYYNEHDPNAAEWLRELIKLDQIAPGEIDTRSIVDVDSDELRSFSQIHLFAGIGVWSYALRQAGWSDDREVISGSCPCQSFSSAGKQLGFDDPRHLWPHMFRIVRELQPRICIGEQVASAGALAWWDLVASDLESENYAATAIDLTGASIGAPHVRSRLFWVGHSNSNRDNQNSKGSREAHPPSQELSSRMFVRASDANELANSDNRRHAHGISQRSDDVNIKNQSAEWSSSTCETHELCPTNIVADTNSDEPTLGIASSSPEGNRSAQWVSTTKSNGSPSTFWDDAGWLPCRDGKYRATKPSISPLAPRFTADVGCGSDPSIEDVENTQEGRMMRLKGYGNAIVAPLAIEFISAVMEIID